MNYNLFYVLILCWPFVYDILTFFTKFIILRYQNVRGVSSKIYFPGLFLLEPSSFTEFGNTMLS